MQRDGTATAAAAPQFLPRDEGPFQYTPPHIMSATIVWIDHHTAKLFNFVGESVEHHTLHRHEPEHHTNHTVDAVHDSSHFYHQVAQRLHGAEALVILGPGVAKDQFVHHLEKHHHADLHKKVLAVQTSDHPTDPQLVAFARDFFKQHHLKP